MKLYIFDADGTMRECTVPNQPCPNRAGQWKLKSGVKERLAKIDWNTTALGVASNQAGIALGYLTEQVAYQLLCDMVVEATGRFPPTGSLQICPHLQEEGCSCRKPRPGMLIKIMRLWGIGPRDTVFVGDMESDREAAKSAGVHFEWAKDFFEWGEGS